MAFFFSAVYSESLYMALSVGLFLCARRGRSAWVGVLGALATATNGAGIVLLLPAAMLYLYGPREDRGPDFNPGARRSQTPAGDRRAPRRATPHRRGSRPVTSKPYDRGSRPGSHRATGCAEISCGWASCPRGWGCTWSAWRFSGGDALMPFHAQGVWGRPFGGHIWACGTD